MPHNVFGYFRAVESDVAECEGADNVARGAVGVDFIDMALEPAFHAVYVDDR